MRSLRLASKVHKLDLHRSDLLTVRILAGWIFWRVGFDRAYVDSAYLGRSNLDLLGRILIDRVLTGRILILVGWILTGRILILVGRILTGRISILVGRISTGRILLRVPWNTPPNCDPPQQYHTLVEVVRVLFCSLRLPGIPCIARRNSTWGGEGGYTPLSHSDLAWSHFLVGSLWRI